MNNVNSVSTVKNAIITYVALVFALTTPFYILDIFTNMSSIYIFLTMWCPAVAAIITALIFFRSIMGFGWKPGKLKYLILAYIIPIIYCIVSFGIFWIVFATFNGKIPNNILLIIIVGTITGIISVLGEEIGWRGFLVPQLSKLTTFFWISIISGVIWAIWHFPLMIFSTYNNGTPLWYSLPLFLVGVLSISFVLAWLRLKSGSLWPPVLLHTSSNLFIQSIFTPLSIGLLTPYLVGETGLLTVTIMLIFAIIFWLMRDKLPDIRIKYLTENMSKQEQTSKPIGK